MIYGHKWRMCRERSRTKQKTQSLRTHFIIRIEYTKTKSCPNDGLRKKSREKILFSYDIPLPL